MVRRTISVNCCEWRALAEVPFEVHFDVQWQQKPIMEAPRAPDSQPAAGRLKDRLVADKDMKHVGVVLTFLISTTAVAAVAHHLPHAELVAKYMQDARYKEALTRCKTRPMAAPAGPGGPQLECWAASTASDLQNYPEPVRKFVLDGAALDAALARCQSFSMEQRFKSAECMAAGRADTFIGLRKPRLVETLKPLTADDFKKTPRATRPQER